jgi:hypothetical protein
MHDDLVEFTEESPVPSICSGAVKPEGSFPVDQPLMRALALAMIDSEIQTAAYLRFQCTDSAARMAASVFHFQAVAREVAREYTQATLKTMKENPEHAQVKSTLLQPDVVG